MVDVAVSSQLQQWTFDKSRPARSSSTTSSPDLYNDNTETLRLDAAVDASTDMDSKDSLSLQQRYLSSEEDLSPMEGNSSESEFDDDDISIHDPEKECLQARRMSIARFDKGKSCDMAVLVSYVSAGRPKEINLGSPKFEPTQRSASLAQLPIATIDKLRAVETSRLSLAVSSTLNRSTSPALSTAEPRRPSTGHGNLSPVSSSLKISEASSFTASSTRSSSPSVPDRPVRPVSAAAHRPQTRSSLFVTSTAPSIPFPPLTPISPTGPHSFLSSDPDESQTTSSASPILKSAPHKRLRSISQKLSLAKIAITPSSKKWDSRINGRPQMPPTPSTPQAPMTAPIPSTTSSPMSRLRRNSKPSRPNSIRGPSPDIPPVPTLSPAPEPRKSMPRLVARGASEREPTIELPPCPDEMDSIHTNSTIKSRKVRKRKSLMDLL